MDVEMSSYGRGRKRQRTRSVSRSRSRSRAPRGRSSGPGYTRTAGYYGRFAKSGGELKFFDTAPGFTQGDDAGIVYSPSLNLIPQGAGESERIGRKVTARSLHLKIALNCSTTITSDIGRIIVYQDKQCNGATATVANVLASTDVFSWKNLENSNRFRTLLDETCVVNVNDTAERVYVFFEKHIELNMPIEFSGATGAITEIRSNNIGVIFITELDAAANASIMSLSARLRYSDD